MLKGLIKSISLGRHGGKGSYGPTWQPEKATHTLGRVTDVHFIYSLMVSGTHVCVHQEAQGPKEQGPCTLCTLYSAWHSAKFRS